jgi:hypothetical protein
MFNDSFKENSFNQISPIDPVVLNFYASFLIIIFFLCVICNSYLLITFVRFKDLLCPLNMLIFAITACNLFASLQFPPVIYSNLIRK